MHDHAGRTLACAALALIGIGQTAEARGFRLRGTGLRPAVLITEAPIPIRREVVPTRALAPAMTGTVTRSVLSAEAGHGPAAEPVAPMPSEAPVPPRPAADAWCRTGRIAGAGTGFCLIN